MSLHPENLRTNGNGLLRLTTILLITEVLVGIGAIVGGIWVVASWTSNEHNSMGKLDYRVELLEKSSALTAPQESRLAQMEYRVTQLEKVNQDDRTSRRQYEAEVKSALEVITKTLTEMQILWAKGQPVVQNRR